MKIFKNKIRAALVLPIAALFIVSCETTDLDQLSDPSSLTPESADAQLLLNNVQLSFVSALAYNEGNEDGLNARVSETMRMEHLFGPYAGPFSLTAGNININLWVDFYRETLFDIETIIPLAEETGITGHSGIAKILKAYTYVILVDTWGNVPYTEALLGSENQNPKADDGQIIYTDMLALIDEAINDITAVDASIMPDDLFYAGDKDKWITLARTLKFKMYLQMRLIGDFSSEINTLISQGIIDDASEDFALQYLEVQSPVDSRHPNYGLSYDADGPDGYMNNYYMTQFKDGKDMGVIKDPRLRYYFYRQTSDDPTGGNLPCSTDPVINFCYIGNGYWGRDHGNNQGVPNDAFSRATYGLYPVGGSFDDDSFEPVEAGAGAGGKGIFPIMLSSYVKFLLAESALISNTTGDPRALLEEGMRASMDKVLNFNVDQVDPAFASSPTDVNDYIAFVLTEYDAAADDTARLDIIMKEYYLALWGNGYEAWNNYRRTSLPSDLSPHVDTPGLFPRTFMYPASAVNSNSSLDQKTIDVKTFWDVNPDNLD